MGTSRMYRLGNIKRVVLESHEEFKAKLGTNVEKDNKKINDDAYKAISKETKEYDGGLAKDAKKAEVGYAPTAETNKGMQDLEYVNMNKDFKDRTKAQMNGYVSVEDEKLHKDEPFGNAVYDDGKQYKAMADKAKETKDAKDLGKEIGLTSREIDKDKFKELDKTMFESDNNKMKKLVFKHTTFLSEGHMLTRVPDEYKKEGNKFVMRDKSDNEYIVEWHEDKPNVEKQINKTKLNEEFDRIKQLYKYQSKEYFNNTTSKSRVEENNNFSDMLGKARKLIK